MTTHPPRPTRGVFRVPAPWRSLAWRLTASLASFAVPVTTAAQTTQQVAYAPPPLGDLLSSWLYHRAGQQGSGIVLYDDTAYRRAFLVDWRSPYAERRSLSGVPAEGAWETTRNQLTTAGYQLTDADGLNIVAWDLGLTKARPGVQSPVLPNGFVGYTNAGHNLLKAGVSIVIYNQARRIVGPAVPAVAANYAVALEILARKVREYPDHRMAPSVGLHSGVLTRFLLAESPADISDFDATYLMNLLAGELSSWDGGTLSVYGYRQLPPALRIARVAAAYRDDEGYLEDPCDSSGRAAPVAALDPRDANKNLCFVDATDRAVYEWYQASFQAQTRTHPELPGLWPASVDHLVLPAIDMRPFWVGAFRSTIQSETPTAEVVEHLIATRHVAEDGNSENALELIQQSTLDHLCRAPLL